MRFFCHSEHGGLLWLARRLQADGHDVRLWVQHGQAGQGLVPGAPGPYPADEEVVVVDGPPSRAAALRRPGQRVIGNNALGAEVAYDPAAALRRLRVAGLRLADPRVFHDVRAAKAFLATHPGRWVVEAAEAGFTADGDHDAVRRWLGWAGTGLRDGFTLRRYVPGHAVGVAGWFNGERWVPPFVAVLTDPRAQTGDLGPVTGTEATCVWALEGEQPALARATLLHFTAALRAAHYVGALTLRAVVDGDGAGALTALGFVDRLPGDAFMGWALLLAGDLGTQLAAFARGSLRRWDARTHVRALTLRVTTPPYPVEPPDARAVAGLPLDPHLLDDPRAVFVQDVRADRAGEPVLAGVDGHACTVGHTALDWWALRDGALGKAKKLAIPDKQYRTDPVLHAEAAWSALREVRDRRATAPPLRAPTGFPARPSRDGDADASEPPPAPSVT